MEIDLLYIADCPNWHLARRHLDVALARTELAAVVRECEVSSSEEATRLGMRGSPTILIDGQDPFVDGAHLLDDFCSGANLFCSLDHLRDWLGGPDRRGKAMTVDQVAEVGREASSEVSHPMNEDAGGIGGWRREGRPRD